MRLQVTGLWKRPTPGVLRSLVLPILAIDLCAGFVRLKEELFPLSMTYWRHAGWIADTLAASTGSPLDGDYYRLRRGSPFQENTSKNSRTLDGCYFRRACSDWRSAETLRRESLAQFLRTRSEYLARRTSRRIGTIRLDVLADRSPTEHFDSLAQGRRTMKPDELFTPTNIASLAAASAAVTVVGNALYKVAGWDPRWTAFVAALAIAYLVLIMKANREWYEWVLAFFNACLLYCSALGINETGVAVSTKPGAGFARPAPFFATWIRSHS